MLRRLTIPNKASHERDNTHKHGPELQAATESGGANGRKRNDGAVASAAQLLRAKNTITLSYTGTGCRIYEARDLERSAVDASRRCWDRKRIELQEQCSMAHLGQIGQCFRGFQTGETRDIECCTFV